MTNSTVTCEKVYKVNYPERTFMIRFVKLDLRNPDYSHRVLILDWQSNGQLNLLKKEWLSITHRPSKAVAKFFCNCYLGSL